MPLHSSTDSQIKGNPAVITRAGFLAYILTGSPKSQPQSSGVRVTAFVNTSILSPVRPCRVLNNNKLRFTQVSIDTVIPSRRFVDQINIIFYIPAARAMARVSTQGGRSTSYAMSNHINLPSWNRPRISELICGPQNYWETRSAVGPWWFWSFADERLGSHQGLPRLLTVLCQLRRAPKTPYLEGARVSPYTHHEPCGPPHPDSPRPRREGVTLGHP